MEKQGEITPVGNTAVLDNAIVSGDINLSAEEFKLVMFFIAAITREDKELYTMVFRTADILNTIGLGTKNSKYLVRVLENLRRKTVTIHNNRENSSVVCGWIDYAKVWHKNTPHDVKLLGYAIDEKVRAKYKKENEDEKKMIGKTEIRIGKELAPFLLNLKKNFTEIQIKNIFLLGRAINAMQIYALAIQYKKTGIRVIRLSELYRDLGKRKNLDWKDFKKDVLDPAVKKINDKTDINIKIEPVKPEGGRKYEKLKITFTLKKAPAKTTPAKVADKTGYYSFAEAMPLYLENFIKMKIDTGESKITKVEFEAMAEKKHGENNEINFKRVVADYLYENHKEYKRIVDGYHAETEPSGKVGG